tara:strand:+ start:2639 stop:2848 length:210 start_codon:yes stop_codon:yes gene_type:complete
MLKKEFQLIKKSFKKIGTCLACSKSSFKSVQWYEWYSLIDGKLLLDQICKDCAKRELGSKNRKGWEKYL